jgi:electron transfer flavoprotein alpha subunit
MPANNAVWLFSEDPALRAELIGAARALALQAGGPVAVILLGSRQEVEDAARSGADIVFDFGERPPGSLVEDCVPALLALLQEHCPFTLMVGATARGKVVAGRLAARLDTTVITDARRIELDHGALKIDHILFGGGAVRADTALTTPVLLTVGRGIFSPPGSPAGRAQVIPVDWSPPDRKITLVETRPRPAASVNLAVARRVVCAGRGLARQEDLQMVAELARLLGAELACTRPLAEGLDWLPRERYIGISGASIHPDLYIGVGVSGQVQHLIGMSTSRRIVAVNKDPGAPLLSEADYIIQEDLYQVVPALVDALQARKSSQGSS